MECRQKLESKLERERDRGGKGRVKEGRIGRTSYLEKLVRFLQSKYWNWRCSQADITRNERQWKDFYFYFTNSNNIAWFKNVRLWLADQVYVNALFNIISLLGKPTKILMTHPTPHKFLSNQMLTKKGNKYQRNLSYLLLHKQNSPKCIQTHLSELRILMFFFEILLLMMLKDYWFSVCWLKLFCCFVIMNCVVMLKAPLFTFIHCHRSLGLCVKCWGLCI